MCDLNTIKIDDCRQKTHLKFLLWVIFLKPKHINWDMLYTVLDFLVF